MTTRHRYVGSPNGVLCIDTFGGVAACALPRSSGWHYSDHDHPYSPHPEFPGECGWQLQNPAGAGQTCAGDADAPEHTRPDPPVVRELGVTVEGEPVTVEMQYPVQEPPTEVLRTWGRANVYPPSDDGGEPVATYNEDGRKFNPDGSLPEEGPRTKAPPLETWEGERPEWEVAVEWLRMPGVGLLYGPWPVRRFILPDLPEEGVGVVAHYKEMARALSALDTLEQDYCLAVRRPEGMAWREAWLTWGWAYGVTVEVACDELTAMYG